MIFFNRKRKKASMKRHPSYIWNKPLEITKINDSTLYVDTRKLRRDGE